METDAEDFVVQVTDTIRTAMEKITKNRHRVVIVLDGETVVGAVSDGDLRRAFLRGVLPIAPVDRIMNVNCKTTRESEREALHELLAKERITVIPVVDERNRILGVGCAYEPFADEE